MKKLNCVLIFILIGINLNSQTISFNNGISLSKMDDMFYKYSINYSSYLGFEYFYKNNFHLNSNLGYIQKGGIYSHYTGGLAFGQRYVDDILKLNYISLNTILQFELSKSKLIPYIGIGPMFEILISNNNQFEQFYKSEKPQRFSYGLIMNIGIRTNLNRFQLGLDLNYLDNFNRITTWSNVDWHEEFNDRTFLILFKLGYRIKTTANTVYNP